MSTPTASVCLFAGLTGNSLNDALAYHAEGLTPLPVKCGRKEPAISNWQIETLSPDKYREYWSGEKPCGVAIALGARSKGLIDLDLDWPEARQLADSLHFIFGAFTAFGRKSTPRAHHICYCSDALDIDKCKTIAFAIPGPVAKKLGLTEGEHAANVLEVRGNGGYTVFPPSIHVSGEPTEWDSVIGRSIPQFTWPEIQMRAGLLAFMAFMVRFYPPVGMRNDFNLALGGALLRALRNGYGDDEALMCEHVDAMVNSICRVAGDQGHGASWGETRRDHAGKIEGGLARHRHTQAL
jgi:hypothetical protein